MADPDAATTTELTSHEIRQQILDRIDTSPKAMWIRAAYDLGHMDGEVRERQRIRQLAINWAAHYCREGWAICGDVKHLRPFADLLDGDGS